jgi:Flp pilus assembly protein TadD
MQLLTHCHVLLSLAASGFVLLLQRLAQMRQLVKDNLLKQARDRASQLVLQYPNEAKIHADLGGIMYKMGDYDSAVTSLLSMH